jgi:hypothetical protein
MLGKDRKCPKCNEHKTADKFYNEKSFYCIPCANEFSRDRRKKIKDGEVYVIKKVKNLKWFRYLDSKGVKYCYSCENVKPKEEFGADKGNSISGKQTYCKRCDKKKKHDKIIKDEQDHINKIRSSEWYKNYEKKKKRKTNTTKVNEMYKKMKEGKKKRYFIANFL